VGRPADYSNLGRTGRVAGTRELVIAGLPYIVPYYLKGQEVRILAVMHAARKWPDEFAMS
jgi:toxin ParE1/3/4